MAPSSDLKWCEKCQMETCWLYVAIQIKPLKSEWRCDKCAREAK
jgi:hypothetical protein